MTTVPEARPAPRLLVWISWAVIVAGSVMVVLGAWRIGISTDEPYHVLRLGNFADHGWYLLDDDLVGGRPGDWVEDTYVYAPVAALLGHVVNIALGHETWGHPSLSASAYAVRHEVVAVLGLVTVAATGWLTRIVVGSRDWGVVGAAVLMAIPMWPGHSMMNIKDVPVGCGFTLFTLGLALSVTQERRRSPRLLSFVLVVTGILLAVGTRPGMWTGLTASVCGLMLLVTWRACRYGWADLGWRLIDLACAVVIGLGLLVAIYPLGFVRPELWLLGSARASSSYDGVGHWFSIPRGVVVGVPTLLLVLGLAGLLLGASRWRINLEPRRVALLLVLSQAMVLPSLAIVRMANINNELRQVLFACPAWAVLFAMGLQRAHSTVSAEGSWAVERGFAALAGAALMVPTLAQVQLFPLTYSYASVLVDGIGAESTNDYWRTSGRELAPQVDGSHFLVCSPLSDNDGNYLRLMVLAGRAPAEAGNDCRTDYLSPVAAYLHFEVDPLAPAETTFDVLIETGSMLGANCEQTGQVMRPRHWTTQTMMRMARCDLVLGPLPASGVDYDGRLGGVTSLLGGWTSNGGEPGVVLRDPAASVGFEADPTWAGSPLTITLAYAGAEPAAVLVNNAVLPVQVTGSDLVVTAPDDVAAALGEDRVVVTLHRGEGETRLLHLEAAAAP